MPRYVVIGAGAIGVTFAAELKRAGNPVALIARGRQLEAARRGAITYVRPDGAHPLDVPVHGGPEELELRVDDVIILATKTQDAAGALELWSRQPVRAADGTRASAGAALTLVSTQNGLETERVALRYFDRVIGGVLALPAQFVDDGVIVAPGTPAVGVAVLGAYPAAEPSVGDEEVQELAQTLREANIAAITVTDIEAAKRGKLVISSTFALDALYPPSPLRDRAAELLRAESAGVLGHLGEVSPLDPAAMGEAFRVAETPGYSYGGSSTWQSLARAASSVETDFINGEVALQARLAGLAAPANSALTARVRAVLAQGGAPRSLSDAELLEDFPQLRLRGSEAGAPRRTRADVLIDVATLSDELNAGHPPALLDVRWTLGDPDGALHYADSHLPTAVYVDLETELAAHPADAREGRHPLPDIASLQRSARSWGLRQGQPVVVYDDTGGTAAARAWWLLRWAGVESVRILDGGLGAWIAAGRRLEHGAARTASGGDVVLEAGHLPTIDADEAADFPAAGVLLDARAAERYRGEVEPVDPRAGHIPGALSAPTTDNLEPGSGRFRNDASLAARFADLGVHADVPIAVYCGSGVTAAHQIAALAALGIDAALFPGSWSAWSNDPSRPAHRHDLTRS